MDSLAWDERYGRVPSLWGDQPNVFLEAAAGELEPGTALDLACGEGRNALWLARRGWSVRAVDFSRLATDRGRAVAMREALDVSFEVQDVLEWMPPARSFDLVVIVYLQIPAAGMSVVIGRACDAVAPGGTLLVVGHHPDNLVEGYGGPRSAEVLYGEDDLARWCSLPVLEASRAIRTVHTDDGDRDAVDCLLVARRPAGFSSASHLRLRHSSAD